MLEDVLKNYKKLADSVEWKKYNCNDLFYECIKHENDNLYEPFFAGIVCRYWGYAGRIYTQCGFHVPFEECYDCVIDTIRYVLKKRVWENEESSLYGDHAAADKAFHVALKRQRGIMLAKYTAQKRASNFNTLSIDEFHEDYNDASEGLLFGIETSEDGRSVYLLIHDYFNKDKYIEGMLLDTVCFQPYNEFNYSNIVRYVKSLRIEDYKYFNDRYEISKEKFTKTLIEVYNTSNQLLEMRLKSMLYTIQKEGLI